MTQGREVLSTGRDTAVKISTGVACVRQNSSAREATPALCESVDLRFNRSAPRSGHRPVRISHYVTAGPRPV